MEVVFNEIRREVENAKGTLEHIIHSHIQNPILNIENKNYKMYTSGNEDQFYSTITHVLIDMYTEAKYRNKKEQNELFKLTSKKIFNQVRKNNVTINRRFGLAKNCGNSCYLDSVLMTIFLSDCESLRNKLIRSDTVCSTLCMDYFHRVIDGEHFDFSTLRTFLSQKLPDMAKAIPYNAGEAYDVLTDFVPEMKFRDVPCMVKGKLHIDKGPFSLFQLSDFIEPIEDGDILPKRICWDDSFDYLLFQNSGIQLDFSSIEPVSVIVEDTKIINDTPVRVAVRKNIRKSRSLGMTILDGKYRLSAVIMISGVAPQKGGGVHYSAIIRLPELYGGHFVKYDDSRQTLIPVKVENERLFQEHNGMRPEIFLYTKTF